jgi:hypothetical protein
MNNSMVNDSRGTDSLRQLQRRMAALVMQPLTLQETTRARDASGRFTAHEAADFIRPNDRLTSVERLEIYNRQYWFRLFSSFEEDFPALRAVLGRRRFQRLMRAYLEACPSSSFSLRNLGSRLTQWLRENPSWITPDQEFTLEVATLEWAHIEAFDSATWPALTSEAVNKIGPKSRLTLQPYLRLIQANHPIDDAVIALRNLDNGGNTSNRASTTHTTRRSRRLHKLRPETIYLAVHRFEDTVYYRRLVAEDFRLLSALQSGATLEEAIEAAFEPSTMRGEDRPRHLRSAFQYWIAMGWICQNGEDQAA